MLFFDFFTLETLQTLELHIQNDLCLNFGQAEAFHQALFCIVITLSDGLDDRIDVVNSNQQTLQHMLALFCFAQIILRAACDDLFLICQILVENMAQRENARLRLVVDKRKHRHAERGLHLRLRKQTVEHDLRIGVFFEFDDDAHAVAVCFVTQIGDAV